MRRIVFCVTCPLNKLTRQGSSSMVAGKDTSFNHWIGMQGLDGGLPVAVVGGKGVVVVDDVDGAMVVVGAIVAGLVGVSGFG